MINGHFECILVGENTKNDTSDAQTTKARGSRKTTPLLVFHVNINEYCSFSLFLCTSRFIVILTVLQSVPESNLL